MVTRNKLMIAITIVLLLLAGGKAMADGPILDFTGGVAVTSGVDQTRGWDFTVTAPITISGLGFFDFGADGLAASHQLGLWTGGGILLASTTITTANSTPVVSTSSDGDWRFTSIAPLTLTPGDYAVGATFIELDPDLEELSTNAPSTIAGVTFDIANGAFGAGLSFPSIDDTINTPGAFGPNLFGGSLPAAVPEPATMILLGSGLLGLWGFRKKFRK